MAAQTKAQRSAAAKKAAATRRKKAEAAKAAPVEDAVAPSADAPGVAFVDDPSDRVPAAPGEDGEAIITRDATRPENNLQTVVVRKG